MNTRYRKTIIAGNWKMNKTPAEAKLLVEELKASVGKVKFCEVVLCVPYVDINTAVKASRGSKISIAAQNMHFEESGAYTGEISAQMLADIGVKYVVLGHSERRQYFAETDETVNLKAKSAINAGLRPIICVGETLTEREQGVVFETIRRQIKIALLGIDEDKIKKVVIAYEPIWAIGTGVTATSDQAQEVNSGIREVLRELYGARIARTITIQYGGSMNAKNASELLSKADIDGGLIGGASLKCEDFTAVVNASNQ
ncbi:MAG: triose-phosphate isomerase [Clostridia bacterium]